MEIEISTNLNYAYAWDELARDLNATVSVRNDGRPMAVKIDAEWTYRPPRVDKVRNFVRSDGMIGSIFTHPVVSTVFCFQVWRKKT
ncbi:unnamed protein product [Caenorhabditis nigoni]